MDLTCKICCEAYTTTELRRPRSLHCGHTLCSLCATRLLVEGEIVCPVCKQECKYQNINKIIVNREVEDIIERLASLSASGEQTTAKADPSTAPKEAPAVFGPRLHDGLCEEHGQYKVHHCLTHTISICSDCALSYHLENDCRRVPIKKILDERKGKLCENINSNESSIQTIKRQVEVFDSIVKDTELQYKTQIEKTEHEIEKLQSKLNALKHQLPIYQNYSSKYKELIKESDDQQRKALISKDSVQRIATFPELNNETESVGIFEQKIQVWTTQVKETLNQDLTCFSKGREIFSSLATCSESYATYTHKGVQRWGRILSIDGYILLQDFKMTKPSTDAITIKLREVTDHLSTPPHVYLNFSTKDQDTPLGMVVIKVNEQAPRRAEQFVTLCLGNTGDRYAGSTKLGLHWKGEDREVIACYDYLNSKDEHSHAPIFPDLEEKESGSVPHKQGLVINGAKRGGFGITSRSGHRVKWAGPAIGEVVAGLPVLEKIVREGQIIDTKVSNTKAKISDSGLVLHFKC